MNGSTWSSNLVTMFSQDIPQLETKHNMRKIRH